MALPAAQFDLDSARVSADLTHRRRIGGAMDKCHAAGAAAGSVSELGGGAAETAAETKWDAVNHLDRHLLEFERNATARGTKVHWASNGAQARQIIVDIIRAKRARRIIKSKVMTSEEIHLNELLVEMGFDVVESDLGEFIQQLKHEAPYHFVFPCMHLSREEISELFEKELGSAPTNDPEELTMIARRWMRRKYLEADIGFTGANFIVAETGMISITENGNTRLSAALPKTMITLVGIEKVVPRLADLALFLPMLATAGTGQPMTCYNTMYGGPRQHGEADGPEEWHVVLLDNHRTQLLADPEQRDALHCIRCGACLNVCPIFKNVGGLSYGTTYQGPIGSVITPHFRGLQDWKHLSGASSLCGACTETCPVKIDIHHHLLQNRRNAIQEKRGGIEGFLWKAFAALVRRPRLFRLAGRMGRIFQPLHGLVKGSFADPARSWTATRELPKVAPESFRSYWRKRGGKSGEGEAMSEREAILERIRAALSTPAAMPGAHGGGTHTPRAAAHDARNWLPPTPESFDEMCVLFARNAEELRAEFVICESESEALTRLREIAAREGWQRAATHGSGIASAFCSSLNFPILNVDDGFDPGRLEACDAGLTECEALVAQTGGVLITSRSSGGRALSVLPPHHVVIARREQLVADLSAAFELLHQRYRNQWPSMISFVTGPSRTGDIERILVLGAHGPKKLTILLI